jgi:glyoxylase-like metal-dependent hydrolase (beta-lactamase superfamily II)
MMVVSGVTVLAGSDSDKGEDRYGQVLWRLHMNQTDGWYEVERIGDGSYRIVEGSHYGLFLVPGSERNLVVDAGIGVGDLRGLVENLVDGPVTLLLTHWHWDHIGNAAQFDDVYIHADELSPEGRVAIDGRSEEFVSRPAKFVTDWRAAGNDFPKGFTPEAFAIDPVENPSTAVHNTIFNLGNRRIECYHTPGHARGHLAALDRKAGVLYGGDVIHADAGLYVHFQGCNLQAYRETLTRLIDFREEGAFDTLLTSHNPPFVGEELSVLDRLRDGLRCILNGEADSERVNTDWGKANRYEFDGSPVFTPPTI